MDFYRLASSGLDKTLRCFVCKNYLSYFPISLCSNNQSVCGRCVVPSGRISYRDEAFETICQFHKFPCRYQSDGCSEELAPRDVPEHEKNCLFRTVQCIINKPLHCSWEGSLPALLPHCRNEHSDLFLKNGEFQMDLSVSDECDNLLENNEVLFIFTRRFDSTSGILNCALYNHECAVNPTSCLAQLTVKNGNRALLLNLKTTGFTEIIFTELSLHSVRSGDKQNSLRCQIKMLNTREEYQLELVRTNAAMLSVLKCSNCSEFAIPPIYRCVNSRAVLCVNCKYEHPPSCKICFQSTLFQKGDNALDEIALLTEYPCKYQKNGCTTTLKCRQVDFHQDVCDYAIDGCPFFPSEGCIWEGLRRDVEDHVLNSHRELLVNSSEELELSKDNEIIIYKLIQFANHLFRLTYCFHEKVGHFMWSVQTIGSSEIQFKYEIDIVDVSNRGRKMLLREFCDEWTEEIDIDYSYFEKDQISNFLITKDNVGVVKFHVNMFK